LRHRRVKTARGQLLTFRFQPARMRESIGANFFVGRHARTLAALPNERKDSLASGLRDGFTLGARRRFVLWGVRAEVSRR
jgi:hypothetical protein